MQNITRRIRRVADILIELGIVQMRYTPTRLMPADTLNKPTGYNIFSDFRKFIGVMLNSEERAWKTAIRWSELMKWKKANIGKNKFK